VRKILKCLHPENSLVSHILRGVAIAWGLLRMAVDPKFKMGWGPPGEEPGFLCPRKSLGCLGISSSLPSSGLIRRRLQDRFCTLAKAARLNATAPINGPLEDKLVNFRRTETYWLDLTLCLPHLKENTDSMLDQNHGLGAGGGILVIRCLRRKEVDRNVFTPAHSALVRTRHA
jgi:hypothetical protein